MFLASDGRVKQLTADLERLRGCEAIKDADLARLRSDRLLHTERMDAKTKAHRALATAFNELLAHIQAGPVDFGTVITIVTGAGATTEPAVAAVAAAAGPKPAPGEGATTGADPADAFHTPHSPDPQPDLEEQDVSSLLHALDAFDAGADAASALEAVVLG